MKPNEILALKFYSNDLNKEVTIKQYLKEILATLWNEGEGFSGKRPLGNSGWQWDIYTCLVKNKAVNGVFDEDDYLEKCDYFSADKLIESAIRSL